MLRLFANLKLIQKLLIPIAMLLAVAVVIVWQAEDGIAQLGASLENIVDIKAPTRAISLGVSVAINDAAIAEKNAILETRADQISAHKARFGKDIEASLVGVDKLATLSVTTEQRQATDAMKQAIKAYESGALKNFDLNARGDREGAVAASLGELLKLRGAIVEMVNKRVDEAGVAMAEAKQNAIELKSATIRSLILVASCGQIGRAHV